MPALNRNQILAAQDIKTQTVSVPEWGGDVIVKTMSGTERDAFEMSILQERGDDEKKNVANYRSRLLVKCLVDDNGNPVFSDADIAELGAKSAVAMDRILTVAQRLNGLGKTDVEALTKN